MRRVSRLFSSIFPIERVGETATAPFLLLRKNSLLPEVARSRVYRAFEMACIDKEKTTSENSMKMFFPGVQKRTKSE